MKIGYLFAPIVIAMLVSSGVAFAQSSAAEQPLVNPNTATEQQLASVPGLNATLAKTLVERRPFKTMIDVNTLLSQTLSGEQRTTVYGRMFLPLNLNTATREEILLIPNLGTRMAREFEEYRPYRNIEQFRREIGKYVDQREVARLERYVTLQ